MEKSYAKEEIAIKIFLEVHKKLRGLTLRVGFNDGVDYGKILEN